MRGVVKETIVSPWVRVLVPLQKVYIISLRSPDGTEATEDNSS